MFLVRTKHTKSLTRNKDFEVNRPVSYTRAYKECSKSVFVSERGTYGFSTFMISKWETEKFNTRCDKVGTPQGLSQGFVARQWFLCWNPDGGIDKLVVSFQT